MYLSWNFSAKSNWSCSKSIRVDLLFLFWRLSTFSCIDPIVSLIIIDQSLQFSPPCEMSMTEAQSRLFSSNISLPFLRWIKAPKNCWPLNELCILLTKWSITLHWLNCVFYYKIIKTNTAQILLHSKRMGMADLIWLTQKKEKEKLITV